MRGAKMDCPDCWKYFQVLTYYTQYGFVKNGVIFLVRTFLDFSIFYIALFEFLINIEISIVIQIILKVRIL